MYPQIFLCGYTKRPYVSAVYARCIRRFLYTLSRVEISVYAVYPDKCGRSYPYIFVYADVIRFVYATCGRRYFCNRIKKLADTKISGYVWTGHYSVSNSIIRFRIMLCSFPVLLFDCTVLSCSLESYYFLSNSVILFSYSIMPL